MADAESRAFDLDAYLARIAYGGDRHPTREALEALHLAHLAHIPFENLEVRLGRSPRLDLAALEEKLVRGGRGGYCFEQNALFAAALGALGFTVATLEARVRPPGATAPLPRTHMVLRVDLEDAAWLADVGFGASGPRRPVPLDGSESGQAEDAYRVVREADDGTLVLRRRWKTEWSDLYAFTLTPALPVDFEVANHYTSTHPGSPFVHTLTVQLTTPESRHVLRGRTYLLRRGEEETVREVTDAEIPGLLREVFGLDIAAGEARRAAATG